MDVKTVERVGVKNLKNNLSAYLRQVKRGVRVLVTDRDEVIAEIGKPRRERGGLPLLFEEWIRRGELRPGGHVLASGIFVDREPEVRAAFEDAGLRVIARDSEGDWVALTVLRED